MEYGLIGKKLGHSYSKDIHNKIGNYDYELKEVLPEDLTNFMTEKTFKGINVTIPYKQDVIPFLSYIDDSAKKIGAVNTVVNKNGNLFGYNTDFIGLKKLILNSGIELKNKKVLILGTGGTSKTAKAVADSLEAKDILIVSRKAGEQTITYEQASTLHKDSQIIINTTPCGMFPNIDSVAIDLTAFTNLEGVVDVVYNPLRTKLVIQAQQKGIKTAGGLFMLVQQAISASEYFFEHQIEKSVANNIFNELISAKQNIVLVGMPGSGKTTIGKILSKQLNRDFYDTDVEITNKTGKTPSQIIQEQGEDNFRKIEADVCTDLATKTGVIIATGGGAILRDDNVIHLKQNGILFFLNRKIENISPTNDRPLSNTQNKLLEVYNKRLPIYKKVSDFEIITDENIEHTTEKIIKLFLGEF